MSRWGIGASSKVGARVSATMSWATGLKESLQETFEKHRVFLTISSTILSCGAAWVGLVARQAHMNKLELELGEINRILKDELKQKINPPESNAIKEESWAIFMMKAGFFLSGCGLSYMIGYHRGNKAALKKLASVHGHPAPSMISRISTKRATEHIPTPLPSPIENQLKVDNALQPQSQAPKIDSSSGWLSKIRSVASRPKHPTKAARASTGIRDTLESQESASPSSHLRESDDVAEGNDVRATHEAVALTRELSNGEPESISEQDVIELNSNSRSAHHEYKGKDMEQVYLKSIDADSNADDSHKTSPFMTLPILQVSLDPPLRSAGLDENASNRSVSEENQGSELSRTELEIIGEVVKEVPEERIGEKKGEEKGRHEEENSALKQ